MNIYTAFQHPDDSTSASAVDKLIAYYTNRKSSLLPRLSVRPIPHPARRAAAAAAASSDARRAGERLTGVAFNDCLMRSTGFRYVAPSGGADELIVPRLKSLNYSSMFARVIEPAAPRRTAIALRGATFAVDAARPDEPDSFLTTIRFRSRDKMAPTGSHVVDPQHCAALSAAGACVGRTTDDRGGGDEKAAAADDVFDAPPGVGAWHRYRRACAREAAAASQCTVDKDNALMRFQKQLKLNVVQAMKDSGLLVDQEDVHQVALRL